MGLPLNSPDKPKNCHKIGSFFYRSCWSPRFQFPGCWKTAPPPVVQCSCFPAFLQSVVVSWMQWSCSSLEPYTGKKIKSFRNYTLCSSQAWWQSICKLTADPCSFLLLSSSCGRLCFLDMASWYPSWFETGPPDSPSTTKQTGGQCKTICR